MKDIEDVASYAIALAKSRDLAEVGADELLLAALVAVARFGVFRVGAALLDLEALGVDWVRGPQKSAAKVRYSGAVVGLFDRAAQIAKADGAAAMGVSHLLAAFASEDSGLMQELKQKHAITSASWREAVGQLAPARTAQPAEDAEARAVAGRDYLTPEEAAEALGIHVQTLRGYVRSGKLVALRVAGERSLRIRRADLETVLEPLVPTTATQPN